MSLSAPEIVKFCSRCGGSMTTRPVGDRPRRVCAECGFIHFTDPKVGVGVMVVLDGRILLVRRRMNPERGKWSIPAGFLDHGENPELTAVREVKEETNLDVLITGLVDLFYNPPTEGGATLFVLYRAELRGGEIRAGDDADDARFFALDALPDLAFASTREAITLLAAEIR